MNFVRLAALCAAALVITGSVQARSNAQPEAPAGLKAFLLRADEAAAHEFPRTPSFSWAPVKGALRYEFELAKTAGFQESSVFWSDEKLKTPAVSVPLALPWMTGSPYAVYARVRAITADGVSGWSDAYGFNVRWSNVPKQAAGYPGLSRWTVVEGATAYHVWFTNLRKVVATHTNAVDHREFYAFHPVPAWSGTVRFRVRAVRNLYGEVPNGLPAVTYGPWSPIYTSTNPPVTAATVVPTAAVADTTTSTPSAAALHELTPAFAFDGNRASDGIPYELYRVYVFSDRDCVNVVFRGAIVGSPAYAPRTTGPLKLPKNGTDLVKAVGIYLPDGKEPRTFMADGAAVQTTEMDSAPKPPAAKPAPAPGGDTSKDPAKEPAKDPAPPAQDPASTPPASNPFLPATPAVSGAPVDLWDSGWPNGRFYWTVVPVRWEIEPGVETELAVSAATGATTVTVLDGAGFAADALVKIGTGATAETVVVSAVTGAVLTVPPLSYGHAVTEPVVNQTAELKYYDVELAQDACAGGRLQEFGKGSTPAVTAGASAFASGLSVDGRLVAASKAADAFYGAPLVAWEPALGADQYQVQWSHKSYPWVKEGEKTTYATSALLPLEAGTWFYRVRGVNFSMPGTARALSWSAPVELRVAKPKFSLVQAPARSLPSGFELWSDPADRFSFGIARGWETVPANDPRLVFAASGLATEGVVFDVAAAQKAPQNGFLTSLNVVHAPEPLSAKQALAGARASTGRVSPVKVSSARLAGGSALRLEYRSRYTGTPDLAHVIYVFNADEGAYVLTFTTMPKLLGGYAGLFRRTAATFRLT